MMQPFTINLRHLIQPTEGIVDLCSACGDEMLAMGEYVQGQQLCGRCAAIINMGCPRCDNKLRRAELVLPPGGGSLQPTWRCNRCWANQPRNGGKRSMFRWRIFELIMIRMREKM